MELNIKEAKRINSFDLIQMIKLGVDNLNAHIDEVNDLNVFPVPDGDTGTNMKRTIGTGYNQIKDMNSEEPIYVIGEALSKGMLLGARGNSGVILSQIFRGFSIGLEKSENVGTVELAKAFNAAVKQAYSAVVKPVEGTILTVLREAVETANKNTDCNIYEYLQNLLRQARITLANTKEMLDVLKEADVIDSGGAGLSYIFEGFVFYFEGKVPEVNGSASHIVEEEEHANTQELDFSLFNENSVLDFGYCTEFILQLSASKVENVYDFDENVIIEYLNTIGDSIVCFKDGTIVKTHVHTKDPGAVLSYVRRWGEFLTIKVENMALQHNNKIQKEAEKFKAATKKKEHKRIATVAVAQGAGLINAFKEIGVDEIVDGKQTSNPSSEDFLNAFDNLDAENIIVLPNNSNIVLTAEQARDMYKEKNPNVNIFVIKTKSIAQGYVASNLLQFESEDVNELVNDVTNSITEVNSLEITTATRDTKVSGVEVTKDNYIAILNHNLVACDKDSDQCVLESLTKVEDMNYREMMLLIFGKDVKTQEEKDAIINSIKEKYPNLEISTIDGGQDIYRYIAAIC